MKIIKYLNDCKSFYKFFYKILFFKWFYKIFQFSKKIKIILQVFSDKTHQLKLFVVFHLK